MENKAISAFNLKLSLATKLLLLIINLNLSFECSFYFHQAVGEGGYNWRKIIQYLNVLEHIGNFKGDRLEIV